MEDFLISIDGLRSEDLTSEILSYILNKQEYSVYQRMFYNYLIEKHINKDTQELDFKVTTQVSFPNFGRPDILIKNDSDVFLIENKFYAPYSYGNQISRYFKLLQSADFDGYKNKAICLLTIESRLPHYKKIIEDDIKSLSNIDRTIKLKYLTWNKLLHLFKSNDFIIGNLSNYIYRNFLIDITINEKEMKILKDISTPQAIQKVFDIISRIRSNLNNEGFSTGRMSQSIIFFGFNIELLKCTVWFGYFFTAWQDDSFMECTPIYMQIKAEWVHSKIVNLNLEKTLRKNGFIKDKSNEWMRPFKVELFDQAENLTMEVRNILNMLEKHCK